MICVDKFQLSYNDMYRCIQAVEDLLASARGGAPHPQPPAVVPAPAAFLIEKIVQLHCIINMQLWYIINICAFVL
jgi:hypothetical protein